jgi:alanine-glyoxylate transaminase/serine-glyoxylate transaminase/serine-pyruvate transaminase
LRFLPRAGYRTLAVDIVRLSRHLLTTILIISSLLLLDFSESHVGAGFVKIFGETLSLLRQVVRSTDPNAQPYIINGSGTLGWDLVAANLVEAGEDVLVLSSGYFGDRFADCLTQYGAKVTKLDGPVGGVPSPAEIEKALSEKKFKLVTATHVDTSTGVLFDLKTLVQSVKKVSPDTLVIADGVCSVACEELAFDDWGLDGVITAGQKAIGAPAGLSISFFSGRAVDVAHNRKIPAAAYFANMKNWTPSKQRHPQ